MEAFEHSEEVPVHELALLRTTTSDRLPRPSARSPHKFHSAPLIKANISWLSDNAVTFATPVAVIDPIEARRSQNCAIAVGTKLRMLCEYHESGVFDS